MHTEFRPVTPRPRPQAVAADQVRPEVAAVDAAMERYANGDDAAFAEVYDALAPRLLAFLRKSIHDETAAEDILQQTLLQMHRARGSFIAGAAVTPWAYAIARRLIIDRSRRRRVERRLFSETPSDELLYEPKAELPAADDLVHVRRLQRRIERQLEALPEIQRTAYRLLQQEGMSLKAAAETLGTSVSAVKLRAHRAYQALRAALREAEGAS